MNGFEKLQDKTLPIPVKLLALCPTKDLVAVVLSDSEIAVYRVLWQKLSSFVIPFVQSTVMVTALEWSPDGNFIAVGRSDGKLHIFQLESDNGHFEHTVFPGDSVASLYWTDFEKDMGCIDSCYQELIHRERKEFMSKQLLDKIPNTPSVLWLSSSGGIIRAFMHGRVPLLRFCTGESFPISHLYYSKQGYLFYAFHSTHSVTLHALSLNRFANLWGPFACAYRKILSILKEIGQLVMEKWNLLEDMLKDYDEQVPHARAAFLKLINGQSLSVFTPYFVTQVTFMGAERWKKQIQEKISQDWMPLIKESTMEIRQMLMRWSRLESFLRHQQEQRPEIFSSIYDQSLEMKQRTVTLLHQWNEWKQGMFTYMERLVSFLHWFCYHTRRCCGQESGCVDSESHISVQDVFRVIRFLDPVDTSEEEWLFPTQQEWIRWLEEWNMQWNVYYQQLEKWISPQWVWKYSPPVDISSHRISSLSKTITYQERNGEIMIAYMLPETQRLYCLGLKLDENREWSLSTHLSFTVPIRECSLYSVVWYHEDLLWCAVQNEAIEKETNAVLWIAMSKVSLEPHSASDDRLSMTHGCSIPFNYQPHLLQISSSPSRNLIGIQLHSKRIILLDTSTTMEQRYAS
ncbi:hypothetical protein GpartN1_g4647.t1 [Galdieria partita]|uniref:Anaphase-promoting complex subunit 4-like WD40 domain-containing protein n=1 Tax=Galdieria partita TaxID=83374 RepID=A0A9C7PZQ7_9RHOD|nr:hypothetical protein GpartN1_g4647.t1 [Galdieria partita]